MKQSNNFTNIFRSTTTRLTGWYLLILMLLSFTFSMAIYHIATNEVQTRLERFQTKMQQYPNVGPPPMDASTFRSHEINQASANLSIELIYVNLFVLVVGGLGSYFLARRSLEPIEKAHEAQSRFTSDASHELRTPLAVMKTELEVALRDNTATAKSLKKVLASNLEEVDKLTKLSEMLLSLSRLDSTDMKLTSINLNRITRSTIKNFKQPSSRISLVSKKQQTILGNEDAITDLIKILLDNALQYSPAKSLVVIRISREDDNVVIEITNTGPGINAEKLPHVFDRFYRADSSRTGGNNKGHGLGLALAKNIVELHNGEIQVASTPDHDTTFTVIFPTQAKSKL